MKIDAAELAGTVKNLLDEYGDMAANVMAEAAWKTAGDVVKELRKGGSYQGGEDYNRSWSRKMDKKRLYASVKVYNKDHYQLAHLLEFGHAKQNGGRTRAFPHIAPVNDRVEEIFRDNFTDLLAGEIIK